MANKNHNTIYKYETYNLRALFYWLFYRYYKNYDVKIICGIVYNPLLTRWYGHVYECSRYIPTRILFLIVFFLFKNWNNKMLHFSRFLYRYYCFHTRDSEWNLILITILSVSIIFLLRVKYPSPAHHSFAPDYTIDGSQYSTLPTTPLNR